MPWPLMSCGMPTTAASATLGRATSALSTPDRPTRWPQTLITRSTRRVGPQRALHLGRAHAVAGDVDHVVHPAGDPVVAVRVAPRAVAREVVALEGREVGLHEALVVAVDGPHLAGPAIGEDQVALGFALQELAVVVHQRREHAGERQGGGAGLLRHRARQRRDQDAAGL